MNNNFPLIAIQDEVFGKLPGLVLISGLVELGSVNEESKKHIASYLQESWNKLGAVVQDPASPESQRIKQWYDAFQKVGISVKKFPPSIHAIAKRAVKGGEPFRINPIVDTYNAISMQLGLPLGAYDAEDVVGDMRLKLSSGAEDFMALGSTENDPTIPGEILYSDTEGVLTRMFLWRQSQRSKIGDDTKKFVFVCELLESMGEDIVEQAKTLIIEKMETLLSASVSAVSIQRNLAKV